MSELNILAIDFDPIEHAMRDLPRDTNEYFLDRTTGQVIAISRSVLRYLSDEPALRAEDLPDWEAKLIPVARDIVISNNKRYIRVPEAYGCPEHQLMKKFAATMKASKLKDAIDQALKGRWSCKRFKQILKDDQAELARWNNFRADGWKARIQSWLEEWNILAVNGNLKKSRAAAAETSRPRQSNRL